MMGMVLGASISGQALEALSGGKADVTLAASGHWSRCTELTSRHETDSSAQLDERSKQHHVCSNSRFNLHGRNSYFTVVFENNIVIVLCVHHSNTGTIRRPVGGGMFVHGR